MANHKSAKKRIRTTARRRKVNQMSESKIKTSIKKVMSSTDKTEAEKLYKEAIAILDRSSVKGKLPKNNASRKKSSLTRHLNSLAVSATKPA
ncbi:MAG: 30S ribosomal protein S20 [Ignavibacteriaceae bacterium]|nr:30S ribosomal protein S20 [Ignavibacteriaceae bacterium]